MGRASRPALRGLVLLALTTLLADAAWVFGSQPAAGTSSSSSSGGGGGHALGSATHHPASLPVPQRVVEGLNAAGMAAPLAPAKGVATVAELTDAVEHKHELFHIVMIYRARMKTEPLCTVESLVRALGESGLAKPATVVLWVYQRAQMIANHPEFFRRLDEYIASVTHRQIHVAWQEVTIEGIFHDTVFQSFYETHNDTQLGTYGENNKVNALRLAVVWKYGGMYMDADMVFVRDPTLLPVGMSTQVMYGKNRYNSAAFKFPRGFPILKYYMDDFVSNYHGSTWGWQGPRLVSRVTFARCPHKDTSLKDTYIKPDQRLTRYQTKKIAKECLWQDWKVKSAAYFLYIKWKTSKDIRQLFLTDKNRAMENCTQPACLAENVGMHHPSIFIIHLWHKLTIEADRELCAGAERDEDYAQLPIAMLRHMRCPVAAGLLRSGGTRCDM